MKHLHKNFSERVRKSFLKDGHAIITCLFLGTLYACARIVLILQAKEIKGIKLAGCIVGTGDYAKRYTFILPVGLPGVHHSQTR